MSTEHKDDRRVLVNDLINPTFVLFTPIILVLWAVAQVIVFGVACGTVLLPRCHEVTREYSRLSEGVNRRLMTQLSPSSVTRFIANVPSETRQRIVSMLLMAEVD